MPLDEYCGKNAIHWLFIHLYPKHMTTTHVETRQIITSFMFLSSTYNEVMPIKSEFVYINKSIVALSVSHHVRRVCYILNVESALLHQFQIIFFLKSTFHHIKMTMLPIITLILSAVSLSVLSIMYIPLHQFNL